MSLERLSKFERTDVRCCEVFGLPLLLLILLAAVIIPRTAAATHADILTQIQQAVKAYQSTIVSGTPQLQ